MNTRHLTFFKMNRQPDRSPIRIRPLDTMPDMSWYQQIITLDHVHRLIIVLKF